MPTQLSLGDKISLLEDEVILLEETQKSCQVLLAATAYFEQFLSSGGSKPVPSELRARCKVFLSERESKLPNDDPLVRLLKPLASGTCPDSKEINYWKQPLEKYCNETIGSVETELLEKQAALKAALKEKAEESNDTLRLNEFTAAPSNDYMLYHLGL